MLSLKFRGKVSELIAMPNIADKMTQADCLAIGQRAKAGYDMDKASRVDWERKVSVYMKLALQVAETKTSPWPNCANVKFPLLTVAALNFHARAYPALVPASGIVAVGAMGYNPPQPLIDLSQRIAGHMSYQLQRRTEWEEETDRALLIVPIIGTAFKKTYYDPVRRCRHSCLVLPQNLVVDYYTRDLKSSPRISEYFTLTRNEVRENELLGTWCARDENAPQATSVPYIGPIEAAKDKAQGTQDAGQSNEGTTLHFIEQHCYIDLDGDGYEEPYIVTIDRDSGFVRRIVARYRLSGIFYTAGKQILRIDPIQFYTKLPFIPSPDGGFYDLGLGGLLGPVNASVDTIINQLLDAGTMSTLGGGFLGRGIRIKKGGATFMPHEWKTVDSVGDDLNKNIVSLPVREPSTTLMNLLVFLVGYAEKIASSNEVQTGELPSANIKAQAMEIADQNGSRIYAAIFKRLHRAFGEEYNLFYQLNRYNPIDLDYQKDGKWFQVTADDYLKAGLELSCAADPNAVTDMQRQKQAQMAFQMAQNVPGHNLAAVTRRVYKSINMPDIDEIFPAENAPQPPNIQLMQAQTKQFAAETERMFAMSKVAELRVRISMEAEEIGAKILNLISQSMLYQAQADAASSGQKIAALNTEIAALKTHREGVLSYLELIKEQLFTPKQGEINGNAGGINLGGGGGAENSGTGVPSMATGPTNPALLQLPSPTIQ